RKLPRDFLAGVGGHARHDRHERGLRKAVAGVDRTPGPDRRIHFLMLREVAVVLLAGRGLVAPRFFGAHEDVPLAAALALIRALGADDAVAIGVVAVADLPAEMVALHAT